MHNIHKHEKSKKDKKKIFFKKRKLQRKKHIARFNKIVIRMQ